MNFVKSNTAASEPLNDFGTRAALTDQLDLRLWLRMMSVHKLINNEATPPSARFLQYISLVSI